MKFSKRLFFVLLIAVAVRVISLENIPYGFHADEARAAWNAWAIFKSGHDDLGNSFPLYYDTFGDQRPTGIFYLTIPFLALLGKTVFVARLPAALVGAFAVVGLYWLSHSITKSKNIALVSALLLALSPWHIATSRSGSEVVVSGTLLLFGLIFWINGLNKKIRKQLLLSLFIGIVSYFFYHTSRVLVPVFWLAAWWHFGKKEKLGLLMVLILFLATFIFGLQPESRGRASQVSIFGSEMVKESILAASAEEGQNNVLAARFFHNKVVAYGKLYLENYFKYFSGDFLIGTGAFPVRYTVPHTGLLIYAELVLFLAGAASVFYFKKYYLILFLLVLSPAIAALTIDETPNLHRALYMVYFISILGALGLRFIAKSKILLVPAIVIGYAVLWLFFWHNYSVHTSKTTMVYHRDGGTLELAEKIFSIKDNYKKIYLTGTPTDPTPWFGFVGNVNEKEFIENAKGRKLQNWTYENLFFSGQRCTSEIYKAPEDKSLMIDAEGCKDPINTVDINYSPEFTISRPDGSWVYKGWSVSGVSSQK